MSALLLLLVHSKNNAQAHRVRRCIYSLCWSESLIFLTIGLVLDIIAAIEYRRNLKMAYHTPHRHFIDKRGMAFKAMSDNRNTQMYFKDMTLEEAIEAVRNDRKLSKKVAAVLNAFWFERTTNKEYKEKMIALGKVVREEKLYL